MTVVRYRPVLVPGSCALFGGVGFLLSARAHDTRVDRRRGVFAWTRRTLLGTREGEVPLERVAAAFVDSGPEADDTTRRLVRWVEGGPVLPLGFGFPQDFAHRTEVAALLEAALPAARDGA